MTLAGFDSRDPAGRLDLLTGGGKGDNLLRYCAWCGSYQGSKVGVGHQIRKNVCEIDTTTICPVCLERVKKEWSLEGKSGS